MSRWFRLYTEILNDPKVQRLDGETFKSELFRAISGEPSAFDCFIDGPYVRPLSNEWRELRSQVFERDNYTCMYCGAHGVALECDHIIPVCRGGGHELTNLTTACKPCNRSKAGKLLSDWKQEAY